MRSVAWRRIDGTLLAVLSGEDFPDEYPYKTTCLPLNRLATIIYDAIVKQGHVIISWSHKVVDLGQDEKKAWVEVETPAGTKTLDADFIVGCDGANSQIRRSLFGDKSFPGHTWDKQIVATNARASVIPFPPANQTHLSQTHIDIDRFGWHDSNFIIHPEHYFMAARIGKGHGRDALWRITYGDVAGLTREEYLARQPAKVRRLPPRPPHA